MLEKNVLGSPRHLVIVFVTSMSFLLITAIISYLSLNNLLDSSGQLKHTNLVIYKLDNISSILKDAETGQRGYLLTRDEKFLEPFYPAKEKLSILENEIDSLLSNSSEQKNDLAKLKNLIFRRLIVLDTVLNKFNSKGVVDLVLVESGRKTMVDFRALVDVMKHKEEILLKERTSKNLNLEFYTPVLIGIFSLVAIAIGLISGFLIYRSVLELKEAQKEIGLKNQELQVLVEELRSAEENLISLNNSLEIRVDERTSELAASEEELRQTLDNLILLNNKIITSENQLRQKNLELQRVNDDLDNFIYTASHDLKAPIANIEGLMHALNRAISAEEKIKLEKFISLIEASVIRFRKTVDCLTDVAKLQREAEDIELICLNKIVEEIKLDLDSLIQQSKARIEIDADCNLKFSYKNLRSVLYNMLSNAIKYRSPERSPVVVISCYNDGHFHVISIQDNGLGIDLTHETKMFSLFKRLHNHVEGTGIGLYIVKKIIENAGGKIEVSSKLNEGSIFNLFFKMGNESLLS